MVHARPAESDPAAGDTGDLAALVRGAQRGDRLAMGALLDRVGPYVGRICASINLDDEPDAAQEALIVIFRNIGPTRSAVRMGTDDRGA